MLSVGFGQGQLLGKAGSALAVVVISRKRGIYSPGIELGRARSLSMLGITTQP